MSRPRAIPTGRPRGHRRRVAALLTVCLGYFMVILDSTVVNIALPDLRRELGADVAGLAWVVDGYLLALAAFLLPAGGLGDRVGARRTFLAGLAGFAAASAGCAAAATLPVLVAARVAQGLGAALLIPSSLALVHAAFPDPADRARAIGVWGAVGGVAAAAGPMAGGLLVGWFGWRSVFVVNLPVAVAAAALTARVVPAGGRRGGRGMDLGGQAAGVACLALLTFAVIEAGAPGARAPATLATAGAALAGVGFVAAERRAADPMLPLWLFSRPAFAAGTAAGDLPLAGLLALVGFGMAFAMPAATTAVVDAAPSERVGVAAAVLTTARQVGSLLGVALLSTLLAASHGFLPGMGRGLLLASGAFLLGGLLAARSIHPSPER